MIRVYHVSRCAFTALLCVVILSSPAVLAHGARALSLPRSIPRYTFEIDLDYAGHRLGAVEQVVVPNSFGVPLSELVFNAPPAHGIGTFYLQGVHAGDDPVESKLTGTVLTVTLPALLMPTETVTVTFDFVLYVEPLGHHG